VKGDLNSKTSDKKKGEGANDRGFGCKGAKNKIKGMNRG